MAADGIGPSHTCMRLSDGIAQAGADIEVMINRLRNEQSATPHITALPGPFALLPYKMVSGPASWHLEHRFLRRLRGAADGDIAWLWPSVSLATHEAVARAGVPIVLEGINTRMAHAKPILDAAYDDFGAPPSHGITDQRIAEEEAKIALATTIFAPSPNVEHALKGSALEGRFLASSYGVNCGRRTTGVDRSGRDPDAPVTFLFVGYACIRKGIHHLLDIWPTLPAKARLRIVGRIEPLIAERYADLLASDRVDTVGFTRDVDPYYATSDVFVFPSLEEGDPLVTYEAALQGLAIIASPPGAGRIGAQGDGMRLVAPNTPEALKQALLELYHDADLRQALGERAQARVKAFDWSLVGAERVKTLEHAAQTGILGSKTIGQGQAASTAGPAVRTMAKTDPVTDTGTGTGTQGLISVVIPTYNRAATVRGAITSVLQQSWTNIEVIVVDDCSSDDTVATVQNMQDPRIKLIARDTNGGPSVARNQGIAEAKGDWVAFQDSDDEWLPQKLELQMARIAQMGPSCVAAYCGMVVEGAVERPEGARTYVRYVPPSSAKVTEGDLKDVLLSTSIVSTQMLVAQRDVLLKIGCFDEKLHALEDWDLSIRLAEQGSFAFVDRILVIQRFSENSITRDRSNWARSRAKMIKKHAARMRDRPQILAKQYRVLASEYRQEGLFDEASSVLTQARRISPGDPGLWLRSIYMKLRRFLP